MAVGVYIRPQPTHLEPQPPASEDRIQVLLAYGNVIRHDIDPQQEVGERDDERSASGANDGLIARKRSATDAGSSPRGQTPAWKSTQDAVNRSSGVPDE